MWCAGQCFGSLTGPRSVLIQWISKAITNNIRVTSSIAARPMSVYFTHLPNRPEKWQSWLCHSRIKRNTIKLKHPGFWNIVEINQRTLTQSLKRFMSSSYGRSKVTFQQWKRLIENWPKLHTVFIITSNNRSFSSGKFLRKPHFPV